MSDRVLCVDDDANILASYQRVLRKQFDLETACGGPEALEIMARSGPFAVIVSDMRMPGMDGAQLLAEVRRRMPDTVRIMLTGQADLTSAIDAVNEGNIFRFLTKPCPPETFLKALAAGIAQHHLVTGEKELLAKTLSGSIKVMAEVLSLVSPTAFGRASRVRRIVRQLAAQLDVDMDWQLEIAALLSQLGSVTLPESTREKLYRGQALSIGEQASFQNHPKVGHDLLANIPRMESVALAILYQEKRFDGSGIPRDDVHGEYIPLPARILKVALDYDTLLASGVSSGEAHEKLRARGGWYDPSVVEALRRMQSAEVMRPVRSVKVSELADTMVFAADLLSVSGVLLVSKGQEVTPSLRLRLNNVAESGGVATPIQVYDSAAPALR